MSHCRHLMKHSSSSYRGEIERWLALNGMIAFTWGMGGFEFEACDETFPIGPVCAGTVACSLRRRKARVIVETRCFDHSGKLGPSLPKSIKPELRFLVLLRDAAKHR